MRILITGAAGMVGSHAAEYFANKGDEVIAFDNLMRSRLFASNKESVEYNWKYLAKFKNVKKIIADVRDRRQLRSAIGKGVDAVIHTAGQPGVPSSVRDPRLDFDINAFGTFNTLETLREMSPMAKFVYCSTNKIYGENVDKIPLVKKATRYQYKNIKGVNEDLPMDKTGHTPYGASKYVGDIYTQEYGHIYKMHTAVFRMSCIYGTRQFGFEDQGWVAHFIIAAILNRPIIIYGDGKQVRDLLYASDLVSAFDKFISGDYGHDVFNIGGGPENTSSLLEFLSRVKAISGKAPKITYKGWRPSDQKVYISDTSKVKKALNWKPKVDLDAGIEKLVKWVIDNKKIF